MVLALSTTCAGLQSFINKEDKRLLIVINYTYSNVLMTN